MAEGETPINSTVKLDHENSNNLECDNLGMDNLTTKPNSNANANANGPQQCMLGNWNKYGDWELGPQEVQII